MQVIIKNNIVLYFSILLVLFSCSTDVGDIWNSDYNPSDKTYFSPPNWIQGDWADNNDNYNTFKFTTNDFIVRGVSYNERINILSTKYLSCTEDKSVNNYQVRILHLSVNIDFYDFKFVSDSEISCTFESGREDDWNNRVVENFTLTRSN